MCELGVRTFLGRREIFEKKIVLVDFFQANGELGCFPT